MYVVTSTAVGIVIAVVGMCCEGSWMVPLRYLAEKRNLPSLFIIYYDWKLWTLLFTIAVSFPLGALGPVQPSIWTNLRNAAGSRIAYAILGGVCISVGDILVMAADALCGTALTFPITIGILCALGTILIYIVEPKGNPAFLFSGVAVGFIAVILGGLATWSKAKDLKEKQKQQIEDEDDKEKKRQEGVEMSERGAAPAPPKLQNKTLSTVARGAAAVDDLDGIEPKKETPAEAATPAEPPRSHVVRGVILAVLAGVLYSGWSPLGTLAQQGEGCQFTDSFTGLSSPSAWFLLTVGMFVSNIPLTTIALLYPLVPGVPRINPIKGYFHIMNWKGHLWMSLPGLIFCGLFGANFIAGDALGFAITFGIIESAPLISALWGIFFWHEFDGVGLRTKILFGLMMFGFVICIGLIVAASYVQPTHAGTSSC